MTQFSKSSFSISMYASACHSEQMKAVCAEHGHMDPLDRRGRCWRCGEKIQERESPGHGRRQADEKPGSASIHVEPDVHTNRESLSTSLKDTYGSELVSDSYLAAMFNPSEINRAAELLALKSDETTVMIPVRGGFGDLIAYAQKSLERASAQVAGEYPERMWVDTSDGPIGPETGE